MKLSKTLILILTIQVFGVAMLASQPSPFGGNLVKNKNVDNKDSDEVSSATINVGVGVILRDEALSVFDEVWLKFRKTHIYNDDGFFEEKINATPIPDSSDLRTAFNIYLVFNPISTTRAVQKNCQDCKGSGDLIIYPDPKFILKSERIKCPQCSGLGKVPGKICYTLICPKRYMPVKPITPGEAKQRALKELAKTGDFKARVQLANQYKDGTKYTKRDTERAKSELIALVMEGSVEGLKAYELFTRQLQRKEWEEVKMLETLRMVGALCDGIEIHSAMLDPRDNPSFLSQAAVSLLAQGFRDLFTERKLKLQHLSLGGLATTTELMVADTSAANKFKAKSELNKILIKWIRSGVPDSLSTDALKDIRGLAANLDEDAFAVLGTVSELGLHGAANKQAAHIYYSIAYSISKKDIFLRHIKLLNGDVDISLSREVGEEFSRQQREGSCSQTFLEAVYKIKKPL